MLLGNCAGAMEARSDVLLVVRNGLVFLDVSLKTNVQDERLMYAATTLYLVKSQAP